jgi:3-methylfumaryl-CoA hydratase
MENTSMQTLVEIADAPRLAALNAVLGLDHALPPPFAHQVLFWIAQKGCDLGRDGHPQKGNLIPDMGLPRRMWAGGQLQFHAPLEPGKEVTKKTTIKNTVRKEGRSGPLAFVSLLHEISQSGKPVTQEVQDLVYREELDADAPRPTPPIAPLSAELSQSRSFTTVELFRYSALTHNGHRIHYDRDYARDVEGYAGIVVHGPLLAQHLILMAQDHLGQLGHFSFRATSPLMDFEQALFCANRTTDGLDMWIAGPDGRQCMQATARA